MSSPLTLYEADGRVAWLTMNNPARRNALSSEMMREMRAAIRDAEDDPDIRVLVIAAAGPVFCSGHDLRELRDGDREDNAMLFAACTALMESIRLMGKPAIASVQGLATAAGCQLAATCDLAVASENAAFATPGVDIGVFCSTPSVALSRAVPTKTAMRMLLTGEPISAREALAAGLVNEVTPRRRAAPRHYGAGAKSGVRPAVRRLCGQSGVLQAYRDGHSPSLRPDSARDGGKYAASGRARGDKRVS